jgi:O-antigen/teichoic acid export membrane protein
MKELEVIGKNTAWQLFGKGIGTAISMVTIFFIIRLLGPAKYGTFALLTTIMNLFYMFGGLGSEWTMVYFLSKYKNSQFDLLKKFFKARGFLIILSSIILLLSINFISNYYNNPLLKNYLLWIVLSMPFFMLTSIAPLILQGLNNLKSTAIGDLIFNIAKIITIPLIIYFSLYGSIIGYFIAYVIYIIYAYKKIIKLSKNKFKKFDKYKEFAKFSFINYLTLIVNFLSVNLLPLILGKTPIELGYLDASMRVGMLIQLIPLALSTALIPTFVGKTIEYIKKASSKIMNYILISTIPLIAFFIFASNFATEILLGSEFSNIYKLIQIITIYFFINNFTSFFESISFSIGKNKNVLINYIIKTITIMFLIRYAFNALNTSLILVFASFLALIFISIKVKNYYKIDFVATFKILLFALPLILFLAIDMNLIFKILGTVISSLFYLFLVWKNVLDDVDRDLFTRFFIKMKRIVFKN